MSSLGRIRAGAAEVEVILKDKKFQESLRYLEQRMRQLRMNMPKFNFSLGLPQLAKLNAMLARIGQSVKVLGDRIKVVANSISSLGSAFLTSGIATAFAVGLPVRDYLTFSDAIQTLRASASASAEQIARLRTQARSLGRTTAFTPQQVAEGQVELARGGFDADEVNEATEAILTLARATNTDLTVAANTAIRVIRGFGLSAADTGHVADVVTSSVNQSAMVIEDYAEAIKMVGKAASEVGVTFEEVSASIAFMADNGIRGTLAGTGLRRMFLNMADPTLRQQFSEMLESFGAVAPEFVDANRNLRPFVDILKDLKQATDGLGNADKLAAFSHLFGRGVAAALITTDKSDAIGQFSKWMEQAQDIANKTAQVMDARIGGAFRNFTSAIDDLKIAIGEELEPILVGLFDTATRIFAAVGDFVSKNRDMVVSISALGAAALAVGGTLLGLGASVRLVGFAVSGLGSLISIGTQAIAFFTSPLGIAVGLLGAAGVAIVRFTTVGQDAFAGFMSSMQAVFGRLRASFGALHDAVANGDMATAWAIMSNAVRAEIIRLEMFIEDHFGNAIRWVQQAFSAEGISSAMSDFNNIIITFLTDLPGDVKSIWSYISGMAMTAWNAIAAGVSGVAGFVTYTWQVVAEGTKVILAGLSDFVVMTFAAAITTIIAAVYGIVSPVASFAASFVLIFITVGELVHQAFVSMGGAIASTWQSALETVKGVVSGFASWLWSIISWMSDQWGQLTGVILQAFTYPFSLAQDFIATVFDGIVKMTIATVDFVMQPWIALGEGIMASFQDTSYFLATLWQGLTDNLSASFGSLGAAWDQAVDGMFDSWDSFVGGVQKLWAWVGTTILKGLVFIGDQILSLLDLLGEWIRIDTNFSSLLDGFQESIDEGLQDRYKAIDERRNKKQDENDKASGEKRRSLQDELAATQAELDEAAKKAAEDRKKKLDEIKAKEADIERFKAANPEGEGLDDDDLKSPLGKVMKSVGAFNVAAAMRIGGPQAVEKQQLSELKKMSRQNAQIADNTAAFKAVVVK